MCSMTIWKFTLEVTAEQIIEVPEVNNPLALQIQHGKPCLWMTVDPESTRIKVRVRIFGTGWSGVTQDMLYVGTFQMQDGNLVLHVFMAGRAS